MRQNYTNFTEVFTENTNQILAQLNEKSSMSLGDEVSGKQLLTEAPYEMDWLIEKLIPRTGMAALAGGSDLGKSALLRQLAIAIVCSYNYFLGFELKPKYRRAIAVCTEDDRTALSYLLRKQFEGLPEKLQELSFIFEYDDLIQKLDKSLEIKPADLVIFDCFADMFGGDLKDTPKLRTFLNPYQQLSVKHSCFMLFLHHTSKRTEDLAPSKNNLLSGQGFESKMRLVMELRADPMNVHHRHLCIVKGNYLPANMKKESYVLEFHESCFTFSFTGERTPFEFLVKQNEDPSKGKYEQAKELKERGYTHDQIAEQLGFGSKGTISKLFTKGEQKGW
jgi:RecA-family ATPase